MNNISKYLSIGVGACVVILLIYCLLLKNDRDNALSKLDIANQTITGLNIYINKTKEQLRVIRQIDNDYQERLKDAQTENDKLRDDITNNTKRVYVKANCAVSTNATTTSKPDATTTRLTEDARQDYLRLRLEIEQTKQQVTGLQNYIKSACLKL